MSETVLITGGTGFVGSHLTELLISQGASDIHVTHQSVPNVSYPPTAVQLHKIDLTEPNAVAKLISSIQPQYIYHLASIAESGSSFDSASKVLNSNTAIALNLLEAVRHHAPQAKILSIGSALEYKTTSGANFLSETSQLGPNNPYGVSKVTQEMLAQAYARAFSLSITHTRSFNHIGIRQTPGFVVSDFARQIALIEAGKQESISVGNLATQRDFTDVADTVRAYVTLLTKGEPGEVYNVGSGTAISIESILNKLVSLATCPVTVTSDPTKFRPADVTAITADTTKLQKLGWKPEIPLDETLANVLNWWRTQI